MEPIELVRYRRALKRKNYSTHTVKSYLNILDQFIRWLSVPLLEVTREERPGHVHVMLRAAYGSRRWPGTIDAVRYGKKTDLCLPWERG